ncbi:DUF4403 family protein [Flavobacterium sp. 7A]|uniref:DUF4403 family protein n=1 Tax=Flavobacterium sp. 7A TaxID=2940571 RepID=UPI0022275CAD|nr:DUF4403 family protein [Flavobacterium sp. 7A]MCW2117856.1 hypothetical protein [Flavobacterium sp. 7A]
MQYSRLIHLTLCISILITSCSTTQKIDNLKPAPDDASPIVYNTTPSYINLPISIKIKDIENQTNFYLNGLIYEDNNIEDDDIEMKIWKMAPIKIQSNESSNDDRIQVLLPLKVEIKYRVGTKTMGVEMYNTRLFNLNGIVSLTSSIHLTNWKLTTSTELTSINWNESPTMNIIGKNMPITYLITPTLKLFKSKIEKKIDEVIENSMNFKPKVITALEKISKPFLINQNYKSWLRINPTELYVTDAKILKESLLMDMGLKCTIETLIGNEPPTKFDSTKIILKPVTKIPDQVKVNIIAVSSYNDASKIMTKNFYGQEFSSGNKKIKVQKVDLWHKNGKIVVALEVTGTINGSIYLSGFPKYDDNTKEIYFDNLEYVLDTKNHIMKTANWLGQSYVLRKIQENCRYSIKTNLDEGKDTLMTYLNNYSPMEGVYINGKTDNVNFTKIQLTNNAILASLEISGTINIKINGLK